MSVNLVYRSRPTYPVLAWTGNAVFILVASGLVYMLAGALIHGPQARAAAQRETASIIEQEDRAFCTALGFNPTSQMYVRCTAGLAEVRQRHEGRFTADAGIL